MLLAALTALAADDKPKPKEEKVTFDSVMKEMVTTLNTMTMALESAKDDKTAKDAKPKLVKISSQMQDLQEKAKKLGNPSPDEEKKLEEKFKVDLDAVTKKLVAEVTRLKAQPYGKDLIDALQPKVAAKPADKPAEKTPSK